MTACCLLWYIALIVWQQCFLVAASLDQKKFYANLLDDKYATYPSKTFVSSNIRAPTLNVSQHSPACDDGLYYLTTLNGFRVLQPGPRIFDSNGSVVWSRHSKNEFGGEAFDLKVQEYKGEAYLTFWMGDSSVSAHGHGRGYHYMLNASYETAYKIGAANGRVADLHDFTVTADDTALLLVFEEIDIDAQRLVRKGDSRVRQPIYDHILQEVDIETGDLLFEWKASEHINVTSSYFPLPEAADDDSKTPWDWIHINSARKDEYGNYLVCARNLHAILYIDGRTKETIWTLGGKHNDFHDLSGGQVLNMAWQHHAEFHPMEAFAETSETYKQREGLTTKLMTIFDNAHDADYDGYGSASSRALLVELTFPSRTDHRTRQALHKGRAAVPDLVVPVDAEKVQSINTDSDSYTVRLVRQYVHPRHIRSSTQGSMQLLPQQDDEPRVLVGYGNNAVITEFFGNGSVACDMQMAPETAENIRDVMNYRIHKSSWTGKPPERPAARVVDGRLFVSWNGATEVRQWLLQAEDSRKHGWEDVVLAPKLDFEIAIPLRTSDYDVSKLRLRVLAIDSHGRVCERGISKTVRQTFLNMPAFTDHNTNLGLVVLAVGGIGTVLMLSRRIVWRRFMRRIFPVNATPERDGHLD